MLLGALPIGVLLGGRIEYPELLKLEVTCSVSTPELVVVDNTGGRDGED